MAHNSFGHIDLRVNDREVARAFYRQLLPELGLSRFGSGKDFDTFASPDLMPPFQPWFGYTEDKDHRPNGNRIAFAVGSRDEVDRLAEVAVTAGAKEVSGPKDMTHYSAGYYAVFFDDPFGNALEVVYCPD